MADEETVDIHYLKSVNFREVACDGIMGGPTPNGKLWIAFYTERFPLPRINRHKLSTSPDGSYQLEVPGERIDGREGIIRNVEFGVYVSRAEAENLHEWLARALEEMKEEEDDEQATKKA